MLPNHFFIGFLPFAPKVILDEKFGYPRTRTRPKTDEGEMRAWDDFYDAVSKEIQIILNLCACKYIKHFEKMKNWNIDLDVNINFLVMSEIRQSSFTLDAFWSDLDMGSVQKFVNKHCVVCDTYFTSDHRLSLFRAYPIDILTGLDHSQITSDF